MNRSSDAPMEYEATLVVCSHRPYALVQEVAKLARIGRLRLEPRGSSSIRDVYFDTYREVLSETGHALRVRQLGDEWYVTLKGPASFREGTVVGRSEIELPWEAGSLEQVSSELEAMGIKLAPIRFQADKPVETLLSATFRVLQDRTTHRMVRAIVGEESERTEGEMVIDTVTYRVAGTGVVHHEIEIEALSEESIGTVECFADRLASLFPEALRPWAHSKLETGRAVEALLKLDPSHMPMDPHGRLLAPAYGLIADYIEGQRSG